MWRLPPDEDGRPAGCNDKGYQGEAAEQVGDEAVGTSPTTHYLSHVLRKRAKVAQQSTLRNDACTCMGLSSGCKLAQAWGTALLTEEQASPHCNGETGEAGGTGAWLSLKIFWCGRASFQGFNSTSSLHGPVTQTVS